MRGRFAPSPTGAMHVGNARTSLLAWLAVRRAGGTLVMRIEDLDPPRVVPGAEARILEDLRWLGLDWDEGPDGGPHAPYRQSARGALYDAAVARLLGTGAAFECACSRAEVAAAASAPHDEAADVQGGPRYPGTCRDLPRGAAEEKARAAGRKAAVRFRGGQRIAFRDDVRGECDPFGAAGVDDFVIRRSDGIAAYQLAVVVDDAAMAIDHVLRADDLLASTPRQLALYHALGVAEPRFAHVPLVLAASGERLAKRNRPESIADLRARGVGADAIIGALAASAGLCPAGTRATPRELVAAFDLAKLPREPVVVTLS